MSAPPRADDPAGRSPRELVLEHEQALARRREEAQRSMHDVEQARERAAALFEQADRGARAEASRRTEAILAAARHEANAVRADGERAASELTRRADARRDDDVAWLLEQILPGQG